ncbi:MAG: hypothetical protein M3Z25_23610 [Actinomycetota bacterium]|nr:hypothetical protein [Actinomycetota bacterium]
MTDSVALAAAELGERVERHLGGGGVAVVHVLSHGEYTDGGGVYVVGPMGGARGGRGRRSGESL